LSCYLDAVAIRHWRVDNIYRSANAVVDLAPILLATERFRISVPIKVGLALAWR
jgi:hypothetical protein